MANLEQLINRKNTADSAWREQRQVERENLVATQDAGVLEITSSPEIYTRYLEMQGSNPTYSPGNIALAMMQAPEATQIGTAERWKLLGRTVVKEEQDRGFQIFARSTTGKGFSVTEAYDITQTTGRVLSSPQLKEDSRDMETALMTLLNYSMGDVKTDTSLSAPALYDPEKRELLVNPDYGNGDSANFAAIATEVAHSRLHSRGANTAYSREEYHLDAQSVSMILCKRFGVACDPPDASAVAELYDGLEPADRRQALDGIQNLAKRIGGSIEKNIAPRQRSIPHVQRNSR